MFNYVRKGAFMLCVASLAIAGLASCDDDDPKYENVTPPTVEVAPNTVSGVVTSKKGELLSGATVTMDGKSVTTDASGVYKFDEVQAGKHQLKAEAAEMIATEAEVEVLANGKTQNLVWNAVLTSAQSQVKVAVSATEETKTDVKAEAKEGNEKAEVKVDAEVPAAAVEGTEEGDEIIITPVYDAKKVEAASRAGESTMLVGTSIACSNPKAKIVKKIALSFNVDASLTGATAMKLQGGAWVPAESKVEGNTVVVYADSFTSYGLFLNVSYASSKLDASSILNKNFDNLYGSTPLPVSAVAYDYKAGLEISGGADVLSALLVEKLSAMYGTSVNVLKGSYPMDVVLPVGTRLDIAASQEATSVSASAAGASVSGKLYGGVSVSVKTTNRQHSGGTN